MIGVLGGSFDPVHNGHLQLATGALERLCLERVYLVPAHRSPHKGQTRAANTDRLEMLQRVAADWPGLEVEPWELQRPPPSYTVDTLEYFKRNSNAVICLITGMDSFHYFHHWHRWQDIFKLAHLVVVPRPGLDVPDTGAMAEALQERVVQLPAKLETSQCGRIFLMDLPLLNISSTEIRQRIAIGASVAGMLPAAVEKFIQERGLYLAEN